MESEKLKSRSCLYCGRKFTPKKDYEEHHKKCWDKCKPSWSKRL